MYRILLLALLFLAAGSGRSVAAQTGSDALPPRPAPFHFVNDEAHLLAPADAKKLEGGLRRYADNTGTQVVVVTVPTLGGREVADYGRALGEAWGVGQREKNNGVVLLIGAKEHKVTIQPGSGLKSTVTPEVTSRIINQMTPSFKQGNYFAGLRGGLNTLMLKANPDSNPRKNQAAGVAAAGESQRANLNENPTSRSTTPEPTPAGLPVSAPASSGPGIGTLLIGALVIGGVLWFLVRMFRGNSQPAAPTNAAPNFLPNRPAGPTSGYGNAPAPGNYGPGPGQAPGNYGGYGAPNQGGGMMGGGMMGGSGGGMGVGGMLATGAAAAAGAYIGNRMASGGHETSGNGLMGGDSTTNNAGLGGAGAAGAGAAGAAGTGAAGDYFASRDGAGAGAGADNTAPDYFSNEDSAADNSSSDFFSGDDDNSSYDDTSSDDTGGGGFDGDSDNSGSW